jgi:uncharacterized protein (DUF885 family)
MTEHQMARRHFLAAAGTLAALPLLSLESALAQSAAPNPADKALFAFLEEVFERELKRRPLFAMQLGRRQDMDRLDETGLAAEQAKADQDAADLARLKKDFPLDSLSPAGRISARLFENRILEAQDAFRWRTHDYILTQVGGPHSGLPVALINQHKVTSVADAEAYIARLRQFPRYFGGIVELLKRNAATGITAPRSFFPAIIATTRSQITGRPFDNGPVDAPLFADLKNKINSLSVPPTEKGRLLGAATTALTEAVGPAYRVLIDWLIAVEPTTGTDHGVWRLPEGEAFYAARLKATTSLPLSAAQIHQTGLDEVARVHGEIRQIMTRTGFTGDLAAFFKFIREDDRFYYPDTPEGRAAYLKDAADMIDTIRGRLDAWFGLQPKASLEVRAVEAFREKGSPSAFYNAPALDGSRPGIFYANLSNMRGRPRYGLETLAYHEGIPGHHMQIAIAQELQGVPSLQRFMGGYTAYVEGWALYTELLAKEMGLFQDPYSDFGRLSAELWRAIRLVVDTGLHAKRWTRDQAIRYFTDNSAMDKDAAAREIDRYIGWPGQAVAYKIGMMHILELRARARNHMGDRFDIRGFHDTVLRQGQLPLGLLTEEVERWAGIRT